MPSAHTSLSTWAWAKWPTVLWRVLHRPETRPHCKVLTGAGNRMPAVFMLVRHRDRVQDVGQLVQYVIVILAINLRIRSGTSLKTLGMVKNSVDLHHTQNDKYGQESTWTYILKRLV